MQEERTQFNVEARAIGDVGPQHLHREVLRLNQVSISTPGAVGMDLRTKPIRAVDSILLGSELRCLFGLIQLGAHRLADSGLSRDMHRIDASEQHTRYVWLAGIRLHSRVIHERCPFCSCN